MKFTKAERVALLEELIRIEDEAASATRTVDPFSISLDGIEGNNVDEVLEVARVETNHQRVADGQAPIGTAGELVEKMKARADG